MRLTKIILLFAGLSVLMFSCKEENEDLDFIESSVNESTMKRAPWVYVMDPRFSRKTCATGPGVCFKNDDGDILEYGVAPANIGGVIYAMGAKSYIGYQRHGDKLRVFFSKSIEEDNLIVIEDVILRRDLTEKLGATKITLLAGEYPLNYENFKHGEAIIPIKVKETH